MTILRLANLAEEYITGMDLMLDSRRLKPLANVLRKFLKVSEGRKVITLVLKEDCPAKS